MGKTEGRTPVPRCVFVHSAQYATQNFGTKGGKNGKVFILFWQNRAIMVVCQAAHYYPKGSHYEQYLIFSYTEGHVCLRL